MRQKQLGFTLVEIAIVLVIIGLLLGGVLKGQELINQAKIKNVINDINGVTAAIQAYQDRYRALPGDDPGAAARWTGSTANATTPGNGVFDAGSYNTIPAGANPVAGEETNLFWQHLRLANFISGPSTGNGSGNPPSNAAGGMIGVQTGGMGFNSNILCISNLPDKIAIAVDSAIDDGSATTGQVRGDLQAGPNPAAPAAVPAAAYAETGNNQYLLCKNL